MALITLLEWSNRHGMDRHNATRYACQGRFQTAQKIGRDWFIDEDDVMRYECEARAKRYRPKSSTANNDNE